MKARLDTYNVVIDTGLVPYFYMSDADEAHRFVQDWIAFSVRVVE